MKSKVLRMNSVLICLGLLLLATAFVTIEAKTQDPKVEVIRVWTNNASTKTEDEKMVAEFNNGVGKANGIRIDYRVYGGDYMNVLNIAAAASEAPHLFKVQQEAIGQFIKAGWIVPIESMPGGKTYLNRYRGYLQPGYNTFGGQTYSVPTAVGTFGVAYNQDLLKKNGYAKPPETWDELREMAKTITKNGGGKEFGFIEGLKSNGFVMANGLWQYASAVGHTQYNQQTGRFDYRSLKPFLQFWADMRADGSWFPGVETMNNDQARAQFAEGNVGFKLSASWDPAVFKDQFPAKMDWGVCRPAGDVNNRYRDYSNQIYSIFMGKSKADPKKVFEVFKLFTSDQMMIGLYEAGKQIPFKQDLIRKAKIQPAMKNFTEFANLESTSLFPMSPKSYLKLEGETEELVISKVILGFITPEQAVADLDRRYNEALGRAIKGGLDISPYMDKTNLKYKKK